jgi:hypothetical protein
MYQQVERLLQTDRVISVAHKLPMIVADTTGNTAASILDAMTLNQNLRGEQLVDPVLMASHLRPTLSCEADIQELDVISNAINANTSLLLRNWPSIETADRWANRSWPTCLWKETDDLPQDWTCLTTIPAPMNSDWSDATHRWTTSDLQDLPATLAHIGATGRHYYPLNLSWSDIPILLTAFTHHICDYLLTHRRQCRGKTRLLLSPSKYQSRCIQLHNLAPEKQPVCAFWKSEKC